MVVIMHEKSFSGSVEGPLFCAVCRQNAAKFLRGRCRKSAICFGFCKLRRKFSGRVEKGRMVC